MQSTSTLAKVSQLLYFAHNISIKENIKLNPKKAYITSSKITLKIPYNKNNILV